MVTALSLLQNLTFEDIHAVRTYEKAWVSWTHGVHEQPRTVAGFFFLLIIDWLYVFLYTFRPSVSTTHEHFIQFFFLQEWILIEMNGFAKKQQH